MSASDRTEPKLRNPNLPDWASLLERENATWDAARSAAKQGPRVLIATAVGGGTASALSSIESMLGVALTLRGANVHFLLCDQAVPACKSLEWVTPPEASVIANGGLNQTDFCATCFRDGREVLEPTTLPVHRVGSFLSGSDRADAARRAAQTSIHELPRAEVDGLAIGEHAWAGTLRYFASGDLTGEPFGEAVARRYFEGGLLFAKAFERLVAEIKPDVVVCSHGLYVPYGIFREVCRVRHIRFVAWNIAYRRQCLIFSHDDTYHHTLMDEAPDVWLEQPWNAAVEKNLMEYLASRIQGTHDWIWFHEQRLLPPEEVWAQHGLNDGRPTIGLLTNVIWDAQLHYRANAFPTMMEWVLDSVDYFSRRPDLHLLIRVHPAEIRGTLPSRQLVAAELAKRWPQLPENVHLIDAKTPVSTYALMERCDSVLIYGTKTGIELTSLGIPVIVAGEAWIRNKGISIDATSRADYRERLDKLPHRTRLDEATRTRARRYAHHFFFRRMIPVGILQPATSGWPPFVIRPESLAVLGPGAERGLDVITRGIMEGTPFVFDDVPPKA